MATFVRYLTEEEQRRLWKTIRLQSGNVVAKRDLAWMQFLCETGLRLGEFALVTVGDALAALRSGYLFIPKENRKGGITAPAAAGKKRRPPEDLEILMTEERRRLLRDLLAVRAAITKGADGHVDEPLVVGRGGYGMTERAYEKRVSHWGVLAGMPDRFSPHWFRHTLAKNVMRHSTAKDPRGVVKAMLGHKSIASTGIYTDVDREEVAQAINETERRGRRAPRKGLRADYERRTES
jgi:site-specific recombinase XerC